MPPIRMFASSRRNGNARSSDAKVLRGKHGVGPLTWGSGYSRDYLFASTEPNNANGRNGAHGYVHAHDLGKTGVVPDYFDLDDAGDAMCVHPDGKLALAPPD
jgi:hypothetical protein